MKTHHILRIIIIFFTLGSIAQTHTWTGNSGDNLWSNPLNWDLGTVPLTSGTGNVIIPAGNEVLNIGVINFELGIISGGGSIINNGIINIINASEGTATKTISNVSIDNQEEINLYKENGISNNESLLLNNNASIFSGNGAVFTTENIGITTNTPANPGYINVNSPFKKSGNQTVVIDVKLRVCCYNFEVTEGTIIIESKYNNMILSPHILISEDSSLIFSGNNTFNSGAALEGTNEGYMEIKNSSFGNPIIPATYFFEVEGTITLKDVTFEGGGTFRVQKSNLIITGEQDITLDSVDIWVQPTTGTALLGSGLPFTINLLNGSRFRGGGDIFLNGVSFQGSGSGDESLISSGTISVIEPSVEHFFNGIKFSNYGITELNNGIIKMDDNSIFYNYHYQNPEFPELIEYGEVKGSGIFGFPTFSAQHETNDGIFNPSPETTELNTINYSQSESAILIIDINGPMPIIDYDVVKNIGETNFEGHFDINLSYAPNIDDEFRIFSSNTPINNCSPESSTSASYNNLEYVFDVICDTDNITLKLSEILDVEEFNNTQPITIAPNPTTEETTVNIPQHFLGNKTTLEMVDTTGKIIFTETLKSTETPLHTSSLSNGLYFARITNDAHVFSTKIIVEH